MLARRFQEHRCIPKMQFQLLSLQTSICSKGWSSAEMRKCGQISLQTCAWRIWGYAFWGWLAVQIDPLTTMDKNIKCIVDHSHCSIYQIIYILKRYIKCILIYLHMANTMIYIVLYIIDDIKFNQNPQSRTCQVLLLGPWWRSSG